MTCRCGHARHWHYPTLNAVRKAQRRGQRTGRNGCRYGAGARGRKVCPCRAYVQAVTA